MSAAAPARAGRLATAAAIGLACVVLVGSVLATPARAHGRASDATNFASSILSVPDVEGLRWRVHGGDELLELVNDSGREVTVLGYEGEPYLRVGPEGVWHNRRSPATYLNDDRYAQVSVPAEASADAEPEWEQVSDGRRHAWHDHRIHWMSPTLPPSVTDPGTETVVSELSGWEVPIRVDGRSYEVTGEVRWVPGPSPWLWLAASLPLALAGLAGLRTRPRPAGEPAAHAGGAAPQRWPGLARPAAALLAVVVAANATHLVDDLFAVPPGAGATGLAALQTALFLTIGAFGALRAWQAREGAFTALGVGSGAVLVGQGLLYWPVLGASQLATLFPEWFARLTVSLSITQALTLGAVAVVGTRRLLPAPGDAAKPAADARP